MHKCFENLNAFILQDDIDREKLDGVAGQPIGKIDIKQNSRSQKSLRSPSLENDLEDMGDFELNDIYGIKSLQNETVKFGRVLKIRG